MRYEQDPGKPLRRPSGAAEPDPIRVPGAAGHRPKVRQNGELRPIPGRNVRPRERSGSVGGYPEDGGMAQQPPAVQVTIGRIEVRAVQPPAVQRRERDAHEATRLDEYLKRRDGEMRR